MSDVFRPVKVATCNLNQWVLDFEGNYKRIRTSILEAKKQGAKLRVGPELETTGYSCEDHFLEDDTIMHSWQVLETILEERELSKGIMIDIGAPVIHKNVRYNCRVTILEGKIILIRPKIYLANDGNYRETRFFQQWDHRDPYRLEDFPLPDSIARITGEKKCPFGVGVIITRDRVRIASETCEELFTPRAPHIDLALIGVDIIINGSGSHHQLRKLNQRVDLIRSATAKAGGCYIYSNQQGCDGQRLYFDGCSMVMVNGGLLAQASQFSMRDVEVVSAVVDLRDIASYRGRMNSRGVQASETTAIPHIDVNFDMCSTDLSLAPTAPIEPKYHHPMEELASGPPCWLWDYLRRSGMRGYFVPLSGGADSTSTCTMVRFMCDMVVEQVQAELRENGKEGSACLEDVRRVLNKKDYTPKDSQELCGLLLHTCYMGTRNSGPETANRARDLAKQLGGGRSHDQIVIDDVTDALTNVYATQVAGGRKPNILNKKSYWGAENIAMQNIQARSRMVLSYLMAQLMPFKFKEECRSLLVLGSANVDEALRGYYTKYDCSAADINPIGGVSKIDLRDFLVWAAEHRGYSECKRVSEAVPTAELQPTVDADGNPLPEQTDEEDMGMSYNELRDFGNLRTQHSCGPVAMFQKLVHKWRTDHPDGKSMKPKEVAHKVKYFWKFHAINRHKMTTLTPSYHAESYSPDDNRFDLRPFLYPVNFKWQFERIDRLAEEIEAAQDSTDSGPSRAKRARTGK